MKEKKTHYFSPLFPPSTHPLKKKIYLKFQWKKNNRYSFTFTFTCAPFNVGFTISLLLLFLWICEILFFSLSCEYWMTNKWDYFIIMNNNNNNKTTTTTTTTKTTIHHDHLWIMVLDLYVSYWHKQRHTFNEWKMMI